MVVEDSPLFRSFICSQLEQNPELEVICEVWNGSEAIKKAEELKPYLILLDLGLPSPTGFEAARRIRELAPESKIIVLSQETSAEVIAEAITLGAWGYVFKTHAGLDLLPAIDAVLSGKRFVSSA
jgi:DNA-binding NarL/FixJ family response regulator